MVLATHVLRIPATEDIEPSVGRCGKIHIWKMLLSDIRKGDRMAKIVAIGIYRSFCDCIDYVFAYCKAKK